LEKDNVLWDIEGVNKDRNNRMKEKKGKMEDLKGEDRKEELKRKVEVYKIGKNNDDKWNEWVNEIVVLYENDDNENKIGVLGGNMRIQIKVEEDNDLLGNGVNMIGDNLSDLKEMDWNKVLDGNYYNVNLKIGEININKVEIEFFEDKDDEKNRKLRIDGGVGNLNWGNDNEGMNEWLDFDDGVLKEKKNKDIKKDDVNVNVNDNDDRGIDFNEDIVISLENVNKYKIIIDLK
jgi:hypothetical protein